MISDPMMVNPTMVTFDSNTGQVQVSPSVYVDAGTYTIVFRMTIGAITRDSNFILTVPTYPCLPIIAPPQVNRYYELRASSGDLNFDYVFQVSSTICPIIF